MERIRLLWHRANLVMIEHTELIVHCVIEIFNHLP